MVLWYWITCIFLTVSEARRHSSDSVRNGKDSKNNRQLLQSDEQIKNHFRVRRGAYGSYT